MSKQQPVQSLQPGHARDSAQVTVYLKSLQVPTKPSGLTQLYAHWYGAAGGAGGGFSGGGDGKGASGGGGDGTGGGGNGGTRLASRVQQLVQSQPKKLICSHE